MAYAFNEDKSKYELEDIDTQINDATAALKRDLTTQNLLWSGGYYMSATQNAILAQLVSEQNSGIVVVFSQYKGDAYTGSAMDYGWNTFYIPKALVIDKPGIKLSWHLQDSGEFYWIGAKELYIHDDHITGHANNTKKGTGRSGITYDNTQFVLRYVYGV